MQTVKVKVQQRGVFNRSGLIYVSRPYFLLTCLVYLYEDYTSTICSSQDQSFWRRVYIQVSLYDEFRLNLHLQNIFAERNMAEDKESKTFTHDQYEQLLSDWTTKFSFPSYLEGLYSDDWDLLMFVGRKSLKNNVVSYAEDRPA